MYLFTRSARLAPGRTRDSMEWAAAITEKVNQISELQFTLWTPLFSPAVGTLIWVTQTESLAPLEATEAKLMADDTYVGLLDQGAQFGSGDPIDDALVAMLHPAGPGQGTPPQFVAVVQSQATPGSFARAAELGVTIAQKAEAITGVTTSFGMTATGAYGGVEWVTGYDTLEQLQAAEEAINSNAEFVELVDREAAGVYLPATQVAARRIL